MYLVISSSISFEYKLAVCLNSRGGSTHLLINLASIMDEKLCLDPDFSQLIEDSDCFLSLTEGLKHLLTGKTW